MCAIAEPSVFAVIPDLVMRYVDMSSFLWTQRELTARSRVFSACLDDLVEIDARLDAHLDGLRVSGPQAWELVGEQLAARGAGEVFCAAVLVFSTSNHKLRDRRLADLIRLVEGQAHLVRPVYVALHWVGTIYVDQILATKTEFGGEFAFAADLASSGAFRTTKRNEVEAALAHSNAAVCCAGCRAAVQMGYTEATYWVEHLASSTEADVQIAAAELAFLLGRRRDALVRLAVGKGPHAERAAALLFRGTEVRQARSLHRELFGDDSSRAAVAGAGASGTPELVDYLLQHVGIPEFAPQATEAFALSFGIVPEELQSAAPVAVGMPTDDVNDTNVDLPPDFARPSADAARLGRWWSSHRSEFSPGGRYLNGRSVTAASLVQQLHAGLQLHRSAAADLLMLARPSDGLFDVLSPAFRQQETLARMDTWA